MALYCSCQLKKCMELPSSQGWLLNSDSCALRVLNEGSFIAMHNCGAFSFSYHLSSVTFKAHVALHTHTVAVHTHIFINPLCIKYLRLNQNMKIFLRYVLLPNF